MAGERLEDDLALHPCDHLTDAAVNPGAERQIARCPPRHVETGRIGPPSWIAVSGRYADPDLLLRADLRASQFRRPCRGSVERLEGAFISHDLLQRIARERGIVPDERPLFGVPCERDNGVAQREDRRVEAGRQQGPHQQRRFVLGKLPRVCRRIEQSAEAVVRQRLAAADRLDPFQRPARFRHALLESVVDRAEGVEHQIAIGQEMLAPLGGNTHGIAEHLERISLGQVGDAVAGSLLDHACDEPIRLPFELLAQALQRGRRQDTRQDATLRSMLRGVGLKDDAGGAPGLLLLEVRQSDTGT